MRAPSCFEVRRIGPYKLREVVAHGTGGRARYMGPWLCPRYRRIEATRDCKYVFSWSTWRAAERAIRQLVRNTPAELQITLEGNILQFVAVKSVHAEEPQKNLDPSKNPSPAE